MKLLLDLLANWFGCRPRNPYQNQIEKERHWRPGMTNYFENVWLAYRVPVDFQQYSVAIDNGLSLFERYRAAASDFDTQHKGSPFYVMGYSAYASHDYPTASLMFDAAVAEDVRLFNANSDKPALLFMRLEDKDQDVLASKIIRDLIQVMEDLIRDYNARVGAVTVTLDEVRAHFLRPVISSTDVHKRAMVTAFISFVAEWGYRSRLIELVDNGSREHSSFTFSGAVCC